MDRTPQPIDDHTLASFMAGTLPVERRREVASQLAKDENARELLHMAYEAMDATKPFGGSVKPVPVERAPQAAPRRADRRPVRWASGLRRLSRYAAAAVVVLAVGLSLRLAFGPLNTSPGRTVPLVRGTEDARIAVTLPATVSELAFAWTETPGADHYHVVLWDTEEALPIARHNAATNRIDADEPFVQSLRALLEPGRVYALRIDALDAENRQIGSSGMIEFTLRK